MDLVSVYFHYEVLTLCESLLLNFSVRLFKDKRKTGQTIDPQFDGIINEQFWDSIYKIALCIWWEHPCVNGWTNNLFLYRQENTREADNLKINFILGDKSLGGLEKWKRLLENKKTVCCGRGWILCPSSL